MTTPQPEDEAPGHVAPDPVQDWSWAHQPDATDPRTVDPAGVAAVLVVHNADAWLGRSLAALTALDPRPHVLAVDNGSSDGSADLLAEALADGRIDGLIPGRAEDGFGAAVARAEAELDPQVGWLWLLHDDLEPRPDALARLLLAAEEGQDVADGDSARPVGVVVPKLLQPRRRNHPDRISELGQTISRTGERVLTVEPGDLDQDQLPSGEVLGASTAGLLVSREAWRRLGGMSPQLPLFRDGMDLGWRAQRAGYRVLTCPDAALYHRRAGRNWDRTSALAGNPARADRLFGMRLVAAHARVPALAVVRLVLHSMLVALGHLLGKAPRQAADALGSAWDLARTGAATTSLRDEIRSAPGQREVTALRPRRSRMVRLRADQAAGWVADRLLPEREGETSLDELTADAADQRNSRRPLLVPAAMTVVVLLSLVAGRRLFGMGSLAGPALAPAPETLSGAWDVWLRTPPGEWANAGWLGLGAVGSTLALGRPDWFATLAQLLAVPVAAGASLPLWRRLLPRGKQWRRVLLALLWGLAQPLVGVTGGGSPGALLVACLAPLAASAWLDWRRQEAEGAEALRAPARYALWGGLACLAVPVLWFAVAVGALVAGTGRRAVDLRGILVALLGPLALLAPWGHRLMTEPVRWFTTTDPLLAGSTMAALPGWGNTPWWLLLPAGLLLWGLAGWALLGRSGARPAPVGRRAGAHAVPQPGPGTEGLWLALAAALCTFLGLFAGRNRLTLDGTAVHPDPQVWLLLAVLLLLCLTSNLLARSPALRQPAPILLCLVLAIQAGWWLSGAGAPVHRQASALPANITAVQHTTRATRALLVEASSQPVRWSITAADQPRWGSAEFPVVPDARQRATAQALATSLAEGRGSDALAQQARELGIGHLWLRGASPDAVAAVSDSPGLGPAEDRGEAHSWTVTGLVSRTPATEWFGPRRWWPAAALFATLAVLLVLAAPSSAGDQGPRRAAVERSGRTPRHRAGGNQ
ncbi:MULTISPECIES: glycosyltransferase [unclassified Luteococcus]|uniref:glycosyltransferase n=1 Tax=unclassified Luteococcus TaxID=2639923 RepID=UPI00313E336D